MVQFYGDITKVDVEQRMVWGYASTEAVDSEGEVIKRSAIADALEDYMKFANIREMHQPSAVGVAKEASVDDKGLYIAAKVVDDDAWAKVQAGVYKGFSIGGKVLERDPKNRKQINKVGLYEISLVDRPANPEATFDVWKSAHTAESGMTPEELAKAAEAEALAKAEAEKLAAEELAKAAEAEALAKAAADAVLAEQAALAKAAEGEIDDPVAKAQAAVAELQAVVDAYNATADKVDLLANAIEALADFGKSNADALPLVALFKAAKTEADEAHAAALAKAVEEAVAKSAEPDDLAKVNSALAAAETKNDTLGKALGAVTEQIQALTKEFASFKASPAAPKTLGPGAVVAVSKAADSVGGSSGDSSPENMSDEAVQKALAAMSPEDRALALIKASHSLPIRVTQRG